MVIACYLRCYDCSKLVCTSILQRLSCKYNQTDICHMSIEIYHRGFLADGLLFPCSLLFTCPWSFMFDGDFIHTSTHLLLFSVHWDTLLTNSGQDKMATVLQKTFLYIYFSNGIFQNHTSQTFFHLESSWKYVNISSHDGWCQLGGKPLCVPLLTKNFYAMWRHQTTMIFQMNQTWCNSNIEFNVRGNIMDTRDGPKQR